MKNRPNNLPPRSFRELHVWQRSVDLCAELHTLTQNWPAADQAGLVSMTRAAAVQIAALIAKGEAQKMRRAFVGCLHDALTHLAQVESHLAIATRLGYIELSAFTSLCDKTAELSRMIHGLIRSLERRGNNERRAGRDRTGEPRDEQHGDSHPDEPAGEKHATGDSYAAAGPAEPAAAPSDASSSIQTLP